MSFSVVLNVEINRERDYKMINKYKVYKRVAVGWLMVLLILLLIAGGLFLIARHLIEQGKVKEVVHTVSYVSMFSLLMWLCSRWLIVFFTKSRRNDDERLQELLKEMSDRADLYPPKCYIMPKTIPNVLACGLGILRQYAIIVSEGFLEIMDDDEMRGVLAHEIAHIKSGHTAVLTFFAMLHGFLKGFVNLLMKGRLGGRYILPRFAVHLTKIPGLFFYLLFYLLNEVFFPILRSAISVEFERGADALSALYCGTPEYLISALDRLSEYMPKKEESVLDWLFQSHPNIKSRIRALRELAKKPSIRARIVSMPGRIRESWRTERMRCIMRLAIILAVALPVMYFVWTVTLHDKFFWLLPWAPYALYVLVFGLLFRFIAKTSSKHGYKKQAIVISMFGIFIIIAGCFLIDDLTMLAIHKETSWVRIDKPLDTDSSMIRYTPSVIAAEMMAESFKKPENTLGGDIDPIVIGSHRGYIRQIIPEPGMLNSFLAGAPGFIFYNDSRGVPESERIQEIEQEFKYAEDLVVYDNVMRKICRASFFSAYPEIYPCWVDGKFYIIAPRVSYKLKLPGVLVPYFAGIVMVDSKGKAEVLDVQQATDKLGKKGIYIFPRSLMLLYVYSERYEQGLIGKWKARPGKIEIPAMPKDQFPYLYGSNGMDYWVVHMEPEGRSHDTVRVYYLNACVPSELLVYHVPENRRLLGRVESMLRACVLVKGYDWKVYRFLGPRLITRDGVFYDMYIVTRGVETAGKCTDMQAICVSLDKETEPGKECLHFKTREAFNAWMDGMGRVSDSD